MVLVTSFSVTSAQALVAPPGPVGEVAVIGAAEVLAAAAAEVELVVLLWVRAAGLVAWVGGLLLHAASSTPVAESAAAARVRGCAGAEVSCQSPLSGAEGAWVLPEVAH